MNLFWLEFVFSALYISINDKPLPPAISVLAKQGKKREKILCHICQNEKVEPDFTGIFKYRDLFI